MPKRSLTAAAVKRLKPPRAGQVDHFDAGYPGFALRISYGGRRSWTFHYRVHGKQRRLTLGTYPALSLAEARDAWREARRMVERGVDPALEKYEAKRRVPDTVKAVGEQFIERYCRGRNRTADEVARMLEIYLYPEIGEKPIETVTRRDILRLLDRAEERGATVRVNRVLANVRRMFSWAVERGIIEVSPVANVKAPVKEVPRDRVLSDDELRAFLRACDRMGEPFGPLFRLLLLTAQRRNEIGAGHWSELDLEEGLWSLPAGRVKNGRSHAFPLADQSLDIISALESMGGSEFLFPARYTRRSTVGPRPVSGFGRAKERLDELMLDELRKLAVERGDDPVAVELEPWRLHDLRRTAASGMARLGESIHVVEKLLNHVSGSISGVAAIYIRHSYRDEMRKAAQEWANCLDGLEAQDNRNIVVKAGAS